MGIRDIILLVIIVGALPLSVMRPFFGLVMFSWLAYMRPTDMAWSIGQIRPSLLVAGATLLGILINRKERLLVLEKRTILLGLFVAAVAVSALTAIDTEVALGDDGGVINLIKVVFIAVLTTGLVQSQARARILLLVIGGSLGLLALKTMIQGTLNPGQIMHGPGGMIQDNNDYGLALVMALPLVAYSAREEKGPFLKVLLFLMAAACVGGVLLTRSRGGVIALAVMALMWLFMLRKNGFALICAPLGLALIVFLTPPTLLTKLKSLTEEGGPKDVSAKARLIAWEKAANMASDRPVFGVGPANFVEQWHEYEPRFQKDAQGNVMAQANGKPMFIVGAEKPVVTHNTYFHILAESGYVTLALYLILLGVTVTSLWRLRSTTQELWRSRYATAVMLSIVGFMAGSTFLSRTHFDLMYHLVGVSVALRVAGTGGAFDWFGLRRRGLTGPGTEQQQPLGSAGAV